MTSLQASLQAMQGQAQALKDELGTELQSQLTMEDQKEVDRLSDQITQLTQQNRAAWQERIRVGVCFFSVFNYLNLLLFFFAPFFISDNVFNTVFKYLL